jgi:hypothetical protein
VLRPALVVLAGLVLSLAAPAARAATCAPIAALGPTDVRTAAGDPERRLAWIEGELGRTAGDARLWTWGWGGALVLGTIGNLAVVPFVSADQRIDWYTGAVTTAIGVVPLVIAPLDVMADSRELRARLAARGRTDVCALLADAETRLVRDAKNQADGQRWWLHVANVVLNAGVGAFLIVGFHHWTAGIANFASGAIIGEAIILTQPVGTVDSLHRYRAGDLPGEALTPPAGPTLGFSGAF